MAQGTPEAPYGSPYTAEDGTQQVYDAGYTQSGGQGGMPAMPGMRGIAGMRLSSLPDEEDFSFATGRNAAIQEYERARIRLQAAGIDPDLKDFKPQDPWWAKGLRTLSGLGVVIDWMTGDAVLRSALGGFTGLAQGKGFDYFQMQGSEVDPFAGDLGKHAPTGKELLLMWGVDRAGDEKGKVDTIDTLGLALELVASPAAWLSLGGSSAMEASLKGGSSLIRSASDDVLKQVGLRIQGVLDETPQLADDLARALGKDAGYIGRLVERATGQADEAAEGTVGFLRTIDRLAAIQELDAKGFVRNLTTDAGTSLADEIEIARAGLLPSADELAAMMGADVADPATKNILKTLGGVTDEAYEGTRAFKELQRRAAENASRLTGGLMADDFGGIKFGVPFHQLSKSGKGSISLVSARRINEIAQKAGLGSDFVEAWRRSLPGRAMYRTFVSDYRLKKLAATDQGLANELVKLKRVGQARMDNELHTHVNALVEALKAVPKRADRLDLLRVMETPGEVHLALKDIFDDSGINAFIDAYDFIVSNGGGASVREMLSAGRDRELFDAIHQALPPEHAEVFGRAFGDTVDGDGGKLAISIIDEYKRLEQTLAKYRRKTVSESMGVVKMPKRYDENGVAVPLRAMIDNEAESIDSFDESVHQLIMATAPAAELDEYRDSLSKLLQLHEEYNYFRVPEPFSTEGLTQGQLARAAELFAKRSEAVAPQERGRLASGLVAEIVALRSQYEDAVIGRATAMEDMFRAGGEAGPFIHPQQAVDAATAPDYYQFGEEMQLVDDQIKAVKRRIDNATIELMELMRAPSDDPKVAREVLNKAMGTLGESLQGRVRGVWTADPRNLYRPVYDVVGSLDTVSDDTLRFMLEANAGVDDVARLHDDGMVAQVRQIADDNPDRRLTYPEAQMWNGDSSLRGVYYVEVDDARAVHQAPMFTAARATGKADPGLPIPTLKVSQSPIPSSDGKTMVPVTLRTKSTAVVETIEGARGKAGNLTAKTRVNVMTPKGWKQMRLVDLPDQGFDSFIVRDTREIHLLPSADDFHSTMAPEYARWGKGIPAGYGPSLERPSRRPLWLSYTDPDTGSVVNRTYSGADAERLRGGAASTLRKRARMEAQVPPKVSTRMLDFDAYVGTVRALDFDPEALPDFTAAKNAYKAIASEPEAFIQIPDEVTFPALRPLRVEATDAARYAQQAWQDHETVLVFERGGNRDFYALLKSEPGYERIADEFSLDDSYALIDHSKGVINSQSRIYLDRRNQAGAMVTVHPAQEVTSAPKTVIRGDFRPASWSRIADPESTVHVRQWQPGSLDITAESGVNLSDDVVDEIIRDAAASGLITEGDTVRVVKSSHSVVDFQDEFMVEPDMVGGGRQLEDYDVTRVALYDPDSGEVVVGPHFDTGHDEMVAQISGQSELHDTRPWSSPLLRRQYAEAYDQVNDEVSARVAAMSDDEARAEIARLSDLWDGSEPIKDIRDQLDDILFTQTLEERLGPLLSEAVDNPEYVAGQPARHIIHNVVNAGPVEGASYHAVLQAANRGIKEGADVVVHVPDVPSGRAIASHLTGLGFEFVDESAGKTLDLKLNPDLFAAFLESNPKAVKAGVVAADLNGFAPSYRRVFNLLDEVDPETRELAKRAIEDARAVALADREAFEAVRRGEWEALPKEWAVSAGLPDYEDLPQRVQQAISDLYATGDEYAALRPLNAEEAAVARTYVDGSVGLQRELGYMTPEGQILPAFDDVPDLTKAFEDAGRSARDIVGSVDFMSDEGMRLFLEDPQVRTMRTAVYKYLPAEMPAEQKKVAARLVAMMDSTLKQLQDRGIAPDDLDAVFKARRAVQNVTVDGITYPVGPAVAEEATEFVNRVLGERGAWSRMAKKYGLDPSALGEWLEKLHNTSIEFYKAIDSGTFAKLDDAERATAMRTFIGRKLGIDEKLWNDLEPDEFLLQVYNYMPHMKVSEESVPWLRRVFGLFEPLDGEKANNRVLIRPISTKMANVQMERTIRGSVEAINKMVGKELFYEDPAKAVAIYLQRAVKAITSYDMLDDLVHLRDSFGQAVVQPAKWAADKGEWVAPKGWKVFSLAEMNAMGRDIEKLVRLYPEMDDASRGALRMLHKGQGRVALMAREEVVDEFENAIKAFTNDSQMNEYLKAYDKVLGVWKTYATVLRPGFHLRNALSNVWLNIYAGVKNPAHYALALDIQGTGQKVEQFMMDELMRTLEEGGPRIWRMDDAWREMVDRGMIEAKSVHLAGRDYSYGELFRLSKDHGILGTGRIGSDIHVFTEQQLAKLNPIRGVLNPLSQSFALTNVGRNFGSLIENNARVAHFVSMLDSTAGDAAAAAWSVRKYLFDYNELTDIERNVFKRVLPFYSWIRKNSQLQVDMLIHRPFLVTAPVKVMNRLTEIDTTQYKPKWLDELGGFAIPGMKLGDFNKVANRATLGLFDLDEKATDPIYLALGLPFNDLTNMNVKDMLSATTPVLRVPMEVFTNYNTYMERPVEKFKGEMVKAPNALLGVDSAVHEFGSEKDRDAWDAALEKWGVRRSDLTGELQTGAWFTYFWKQLGPHVEAYGKALPNGDSDYGTLLLNFLTGVRFIPLNQEEQGYFTERANLDAIEEGVMAVRDRGVDVPNWSDLPLEAQMAAEQRMRDRGVEP